MKKTTKKLSIAQFIDMANSTHYNKYDYSLSVYDGRKIKIKIICPNHGVFEQTPDAHISGSGCPSCAKLTVQNNLYYKNKNYYNINFIDRANKIHGQYDYSKFFYKNARTKGLIICQIHGEFTQTPDNHLNGHGCPDCSNNKKLTTSSFIKKANKIHTKYSYELVNYINNLTKIKIICLDHGIFTQRPADHLNGQGCPKCLFKNQAMVGLYLESCNIQYIAQYKIMFNKNHIIVDFYIPKFNLIIEYNGPQHYGPVCFGGISRSLAIKNLKKQQTRDQRLREYCHDKNINLLEINWKKYQMEHLKNFLSEYFKKVA